MSSPYDPKNPLYQGQAPTQPQQAPQQHASGFHLLGGVGDLVVAAAHFFAGGGGAEDDDEAEEPKRPRRFRPRVFGARSGSARAGQGSCCRRPAGK